MIACAMEPSTAPAAAEVAGRALGNGGGSPIHSGVSPSPERSPAAGAVSLRTVVVRSARELTEHLPALEDLVADALERNVFYEPMLVAPAVERFGAGRQLALVCVYGPDPEAPQRPRLCGFFPFERVRRYRGIPVSAIVSFMHPHCFLGTPLVRGEGADATFAAVFDWLIDQAGVAVVELHSITAEGPLHQRLVQELHERRRPFWLGEWSTRAMFRPGPDAEHYLRRAISGKALKEARRKERRLGEQGRLVVRELQAGEDVQPWLDDFLRLEASGWKGGEGTALASSHDAREFFVSAARAAHESGRLMLLGLFLDGRPLALKCNFLAGDGGFAFKIAFDETYAAYSPGFLLEIESVRRLHELPAVRWMDSCADAEHAMINRLWPGRRTMTTVLFATGRAPGELLVSLMPLLKWAQRRLARRPRPTSRAETVERDTRVVSTTNAAATAHAQWLQIDPASFREHFDRQPFRVRHRLCDHPLFSLPRLIELARSLPEDRVEYNAGNVPVSLDPSRTPRTGLSIEETIRRIEECRSWMVLKNVERDAEYRSLLDRCLDQVREHSETRCPGMHAREGFIFISSPDSVTPYHMDPEHNFLLQIRGRKQICLFDGDDRELLSEPELERFYARGHRNLVFDDAKQARAKVCELTPGDGLHFPVTWPHWVKNGGEVSISFSITFRTRSSDRREMIYHVNHQLRRLKLPASPVGRSHLADEAKCLAFRTLRCARRLLARRRERDGRTYH